MNRIVSLSALAATVLLATTTIVAAQQSRAPEYVDVGRDFRQSDQVTMGSNLLTPEEQSRFDSMRKQAKTQADKNRVEAEESALLNQRVNERVTAALSQPVSPSMQTTPSTAERPSSEVPGYGMGSGGMGTGAH